MMKEAVDLVGLPNALYAFSASTAGPRGCSELQKPLIFGINKQVGGAPRAESTDAASRRRVRAAARVDRVAATPSRRGLKGPTAGPPETGSWPGLKGPTAGPRETGSRPGLKEPTAGPRETESRPGLKGSTAGPRETGSRGSLGRPRSRRLRAMRRVNAQHVRAAERKSCWLVLVSPRPSRGRHRGGCCKNYRRRSSSLRARSVQVLRRWEHVVVGVRVRQGRGRLGAVSEPVRDGLLPRHAQQAQHAGLERSQVVHGVRAPTPRGHAKDGLRRRRGRDVDIPRR